MPLGIKAPILLAMSEKPEAEDLLQRGKGHHPEQVLCSPWLGAEREVAENDPLTEPAGKDVLVATAWRPSHDVWLGWFQPGERAGTPSETSSIDRIINGVRVNGVSAPISRNAKRIAETSATFAVSA